MGTTDLVGGYPGPVDRLDAYRDAIASLSQVDLKGATMPYTSLNGHMFSFLDKTGAMALRLSTADRDEFLSRYESRIAEQHGRTMKEFVVVPDDLLDDAASMGVWLERSRAWIATLTPKPTKRG